MTFEFNKLEGVGDLDKSNSVERRGWNPDWSWLREWQISNSSEFFRLQVRKVKTMTS